MGNLCERCKKRKNANTQNPTNTTQNVLISNQLDPNNNYNISSVGLNNDANQNPLIQQGNNGTAQLIQLKNTHNDLKNKFKTIMNKNTTFYQDMKKQNEYISNYKSFLNDLNHELNNYHEQLNISIRGQKLEEALSNKKDNAQLIKELDQISYKIKELNSLLETQNSELKNLEINYKIIQEKFNFVKLNKNKNDINQEILLSQNNKIISDQLNELEQISIRLLDNKNLYEAKKSEIEQDIKNIQNKTKKKVTEVEIKRKNTLKGLNMDKNNQMNEPLFLKGSMLLSIKDFSKAKDIFNSMYLFQNEKEENYTKQELLRKNWKEICYIYDEYDIHDVNYELKAVGLPENVFFSSCSFGFILDTDIQILEFEIDGKKSEYDFEQYSLKFNINLKNLESNKIHMKYKESILKSKLTKGELEQQKMSKVNNYGIYKILVGQKAKYVLNNKSNYEIINFEDEFFIKTNENEYTWGGIVPEGGKRTFVRLSKREAKYQFYEKYSISTMNNSPINNTTLTIPFGYKGGNNKIIKLNYASKQTKSIKEDNDLKKIEVQFLNTKSNIGEFEIQGELLNRCKGEWICYLTDEEIESLIPEDYKANKQKFKEISTKIIEEYNKKHKNDLVQISDVAKVGKWVKNNVKYNINYSGRTEITATDTYNNLEGVCEHFTKLYNALIYSLGYKVIYVSGYAIKKKDFFVKDDGHAWSLIKIGEKWLPFDATWGIFSGKLPISHVFKSFSGREFKTNGYDSINIGNTIIKGKYLG